MILLSASTIGTMISSSRVDSSFGVSVTKAAASGSGDVDPSILPYCLLSAIVVNVEATEHTRSLLSSFSDLRGKYDQSRLVLSTFYVFARGFMRALIGSVERSRSCIIGVPSKIFAKGDMEVVEVFMAFMWYFDAFIYERKG